MIHRVLIYYCISAFKTQQVWTSLSPFLVQNSDVCGVASGVQPKITSSLSSSTSSTETFERAKTWLSTWLSFHSLCSKSRQTPKPSINPHQLPIRLLEIDIDCPLPVKSVRLRCDGCNSDCFTLSHCWGTFEGNVLRLLQDNLERFMQQVLIETCQRHLETPWIVHIG